MSFDQKRKFSLKEHVPITWRAGLAFVYLKALKRKKVMNFKLKERIMLAITEVNGCVLCSYVHTKLALSGGMSDLEIKTLLEGELELVPAEESLAVLFAKDYAFNHEILDSIYYQKIIERYGIDKAKAILSVSEMITMTNSMGISLGLLKQTLSFKHVKGSRIYNELLIPLLTMVLFPISVIAGLFVLPFTLRNIKFYKAYHHQKEAL
jgi:AhpD family alkylhydroperoxidase